MSCCSTEAELTCSTLLWKKISSIDTFLKKLEENHKASPDDIRKYVIDAIEKDTSKLSMDRKFKNEIVHEIVESSNGMLVGQKENLYITGRSCG